MKELPVYLFNGFLESGKTSFIQDILRDPNFTEDERSLLIVCEEGIEEYDISLLHDARTEIVVVDDISELTLSYFRQLSKQYDCDRILIEFNGMWELPAFLEEKLPPEWALYQIVTTVNAQTFELYSNNIGPRMFEHLSMADLIVFNRCTHDLKQMLYRKNIRAINPRATIFLDDINGNSEDYRDNMPCPFDLQAPVIEVSDQDFGLWYVDANSNPERYDGKTVHFKGMVYQSEEMAKENILVPGRFAMVCCADDIQFVGFLCKNAGQFSSKTWVDVTAEIRLEVVEQYRGTGPVLYCHSISKTQPPKEELVYFN